MESRHLMSRWTAVYTMIRGMLLVSSAAILNFGFIASSMAAIIPVFNAGFEEPTANQGAFTDRVAIPGWTITPVVGLDDRAGIWFPPVGVYPGGVPEGNQVGYSNGPTLSQILPWNLAANEPYLLTVEIGNRGDLGPFRQIQGYEVQLLAGGTVLDFVDETMVLPDPGTFETATVSFTADATNPNIGQPLEIRLLSDGPQVNFDSVSVGAVPIPPAVWLFGSGLLGLVGIARRKKVT